MTRPTMLALLLGTLIAGRMSAQPKSSPTPTTFTLPKSSGLTPAATKIPTPNTEAMQALLPPAPEVTDWQPRNRAVVGGRIVITGRDLRPQDFIAVVGSQKFRLPVRQGGSTATRIELDVPDGALGMNGPLAVGYPRSQSRTLDATYRVEAPKPDITSLGFGQGAYPFVVKSASVKVKEFPGTKMDLDALTTGGSCRFVKKPGISYGTVDRDENLGISFSFQGWFEKSGNCGFDLDLVPLTEKGQKLPAVHVHMAWTVPDPVTYSFSSTADLKGKLKPELSHFGVGSVCTGGNRGVDDSGGDFSVVIRGGPLDVDCTFRTKEWILPEGVRLKEIRWNTSKQGNRCGNGGTFSHTFPSFDLGTLSRGAILVRPNADQPESDFVVFGTKELVVDGVTYASNLSGPRVMLKPMVLPMQCVSMATVLTDSNGTHGPTLDPQSFRIVLEKLVFEGPPNLTLP